MHLGQVFYLRITFWLYEYKKIYKNKQYVCPKGTTSISATYKQVALRQEYDQVYFKLTIFIWSDIYLRRLGC